MSSTSTSTSHAYHASEPLGTPGHSITPGNDGRGAKIGSARDCFTRCFQTTMSQIAGRKHLLEIWTSSETRSSILKVGPTGGHESKPPIHFDGYHLRCSDGLLAATQCCVNESGVWASQGSAGAEAHPLSSLVFSLVYTLDTTLISRTLCEHHALGHGRQQF